MFVFSTLCSKLTSLKPVDELNCKWMERWCNNLYHAITWRQLSEYSKRFNKPVELNLNFKTLIKDIHLFLFVFNQQTILVLGRWGLKRYKGRAGFYKRNCTFSTFPLAVWKTVKELGREQRTYLKSLMLSLVKRGVPILSMPHPSHLYWPGATTF